MQIFTKNWSYLMDTQDRLFTPGYLRDLGATFDKQFNSETIHPDPTVNNQDVISDELLQALAQQTLVGYDIPMLFEPTGRSRHTIALVFQDPLRKGDGNGIQIGTPFGLHIKKQRYLRHYGMVWNWIEKIVEQNVSVLLTDALKLYPIRNRKLADNMHLQSVCELVLKDELKATNAERIFCLGNDAHNAVSRMNISNQHFRHITAYGLTRLQKDAIGENIIARATS